MRTGGVAISAALALVGSGAARADAPSKVAVGIDPDGRLEVFYVERDGTLHHKWQTAPTATCHPYPANWADAAALEGSTPEVASVALGTNADGRMEVFFVGEGGQIYHSRQSAAGGAFAAAAKFEGTARNIVVGKTRDGKLAVFSVGLDGYLSHARQLAPSSDKWDVAAMTAAPAPKASSEIAVEAFQDGRLVVFFVDQGGEVEEILEKPSFDGWEPPKKLGAKATHIAASHNKGGRVEILLADDVALNHGVQSANDVDSWIFSPLDAHAASRIASAINQDGRIEVLFVDAKGDLRHLAQKQPGWNSVWSSAPQFGWQTQSMTGRTNAAGCLEVFYVRDDGALYHQYQLTAGWWWSGEYPLHDVSPPPPFKVSAFSQILATWDGLPAATSNWAINDHTIVQGKNGGWHFFGIVSHDRNVAGVINWLGAAVGPPGPLLGPSPTLHYKQLSNGGDPAFTLPAAFPPEDLKGGRVLWAPHVVLSGDTHYMFYCDGSGTYDQAAYQIALRTSKDLLTWTDPQTELFADGYQTRDPMVLDLGNGEWVMYYTATEPRAGGHHIVAYRTSKSIGDASQWAASARGIAYGDSLQGTDSGGTESPFVVHRGPYYYLFIGPRPYSDSVTSSSRDAPDRPLEPDNIPGTANWNIPGYVGTDVFRSTDWRHWTNADFVANIPAHALEVIHDQRDGKWYVTSAGSKQGGLFAAELVWTDGP